MAQASGHRGRSRYRTWIDQEKEILRDFAYKNPVSVFTYLNGGIEDSC